MKETAETNDTAATVAQQGATVAPEKTSPKKGASQKKGKPKAKKPVKAAAPKNEAKATKKVTKPAQAKATGPRAESKGAKILKMIGRPEGATLAEIMTATGWQKAHSVRGFISTAGKKHGITIKSSKNEAGDRVYQTSM
jgi:cell division septation protein DedD